MDKPTRTKLAQIIGAFVTAFLIWLLGWLCGCSVLVDRDKVLVEFGYPNANHEHALRVTQPDQATTAPAPGPGT